MKHFERYMELRELEAAPKTLETERETHQAFWSWLEGRAFKGDELDVRRSDILAYADYIFNNSQLRRNTGRLRVLGLRNFYEEAVRQEWIIASPYRGIELPKEEKNPVPVLSVEQVSKIIESPDLTTVNGVRDRFIMEMMYACALRLADIHQLTINQFSNDYKYVTLKGKGGRVDRLYVVSMAREMVKRWIHHFQKLNKYPSNTTLALSVKSGKPMSRRMIQDNLKRYIEAVVPNQFSGTHLFRYAILSHLADSGVDIRLLKEFSRHEKNSTVLKYINQSFQRMERVYSKAHPSC